MSEYCDTYKNILKGKYDTKRHNYIKDEGGYKVKALYKELLTDFIGDYKATANYTVNINNSINLNKFILLG